MRSAELVQGPCEPRPGHAGRLKDPAERKERDVPLAPLDPGHVGTVKPRPLGQGLLGKARLLAKLAEDASQASQLSGSAAHARTFAT